jgi:hypothetical protein
MSAGGAPGGLAFDTDASYAVMNDKVQALAGSIYEELERMITKYDQASSWFLVRDSDDRQSQYRNFQSLL